MTIIKAKLPIRFDYEMLAADADRFAADEWIPHFNIHNYEGEWSVIPLRAVKGGNSAIFPDPNATDGYVETEQMSICRYVPEVLTAFECEMETVRFMKLAAGAQIRRHRDYALGLEDGVCRIHIPAATNDEVEFMLADERVQMAPGEAWYLNVNNYHSVANRGATDRIHLVIDCVVNNWLTTMIEDSVY
ncbi:MAG TPA: aspartyl/asparaginyl beta-hydroxylase domain-containing protein [Pyrinomonadaceae bacterium]|nr:aspartyl/asparaginyl beta-hydroxylase domain-containing protein [Chloracidobacterium sp.]MBP9935720.1 aspartyl/asparaginyl beta-hydroxylase domain-containing protein [Pyrinomonadaceae bacterium]MBK7801792.1 aspartyl/asparaginyl beta-hydroxylase domain-containing protein [Chloracidobacterium sp.]MBK9768810.1 aspartyl/asparaginyl beta-hydroxylase domain-containing protein [Chloracidobacterium sp.]MBL0242102.1 aspartyl/asparaginyl beta-hydroxylase domain-containing protein [Chloracidobacterium 